jgi:hypothetical protein
MKDCRIYVVLIIAAMWATIGFMSTCPGVPSQMSGIIAMIAMLPTTVAIGVCV